MSSSGKGKARPDAELYEALAELILSTRRRKRAASLVDAAERLQLAIKKLGSYEAVADRIGLSPHMLRQFSSVDKLSSEVKELFKNRTLDSVDAATHLAMLSFSDQRAIAREMVDGNLNTMDVRAVVQLRKSMPSEAIGQLAGRVKETRMRRHYIFEFIAREGITAKTIQAKLARHVNSSEIVSVTVDGFIGQINLTENGKRQLAAVARSMRLPLKNALQVILQQK